ncbi:hypothetical protein AA544_004776 [Salmonella enterica subsp. salamae]|nr:hypothetical protein [Salmonella enterica subsp. salamae]
MGSCAAPSAKGDDKFITTDYLQQCLGNLAHNNLDRGQFGDRKFLYVKHIIQPIRIRK